MSSLLLYITLNALVSNEGFVPHPYKIYGIWHIGFGYNLEANMPEPGPDCKNYSCLYWTREKAFEVLSNEVIKIDTRLKREVSCYQKLKPKGQAVLIDMAYNMGITGALSFKKMLSALCSGSYEWAAHHLLDSKYARKLPKRAERNAEVLRGDYTL